MLDLPLNLAAIHEAAFVQIYPLLHRIIGCKLQSVQKRSEYLSIVTQFEQSLVSLKKQHNNQVNQ